MIYLIAILIYLAVLTVVGVVKAKQVKTQDDFAVAGRSLSPWVMVLTMLAVWIGTGSILGNAEEAYNSGMAALIIPFGTFFGLILLSFIATKARDIEACSVPEIIGNRFGTGARFLAVIALIMAYMVIVSYQFNAGGGVLEVITGDKAPLSVAMDDAVTKKQLTRGQLIYTPDTNYVGDAVVSIQPDGNNETLDYTIHVIAEDKFVETINALKQSDDQLENVVFIKAGDRSHIQFDEESLNSEHYRISGLPREGKVEYFEPKLSREKATIIAAVFIIIYTMLAGLKSLASMDVITGSIITISLVIAFPVMWFMAGGWDGMQASYLAMGAHEQHMKFWGVYSPIHILNYLLPVFLLVMGDANQYQRIFASRNSKGAKQAVVTLIFAALAIEMLIIATAWVAGSMTPEQTNGRYILIHAAAHLMPQALGLLFMVTVVGVIISTADSFLLVPATTFINDIYCKHINPKADEKRVVLISRALVVLFGVIAYFVSMAFSASTGFFKKALLAYTIYGSAITPSLMAAMFWKGATKAGAISSILAGTVVTLIWAPCLKGLLPENLQEVDAVLPAIFASIIALVVVSLNTSPSKES